MSQTAGQWLKQQREQQQITQEDVAHECRLSLEMVQKIEADDIETLRQTPYLKGYIRAMAKALDVSPEEPLRRLEGETSPADAMPQAGATVVEDVAIQAVSEAPAARPPMWREKWRLLAAGAGTLLLLTMGTWWLNRDSTVPLATLAVSEESPEVSMDDQDAGMDVAVLPVEDSATLTLDFSVQTWASIFDANQDKLITGLMPVGESIVLTGKPPFEILLGEADAVGIRYNDRWVDLSDFAQQKMIQFSLNRAEISDAQW